MSVLKHWPFEYKCLIPFATGGYDTRSVTKNLNGFEFRIFHLQERTQSTLLITLGWEEKEQMIHDFLKVWFFGLMAYHPLWVIQCQNLPCRRTFVVTIYSIAGRDKGVHAFPKGISLKVNVIVLLKFKLTMMSQSIILTWMQWDCPHFFKGH